MVIDMVADEQTRMERDRIERLRDFSHARCLTHDELGAMLVDAGLCVASVEVAPMEQRLEPWLELTGHRIIMLGRLAALFMPSLRAARPRASRPI